MFDFKPMLANKFKGKLPKGEVYVQPKLDGIRCLAKRVDGKVVLQSRSGKPLNVPHIVESLRDLPNDLVLDGELYIHGMRFDDISSLVRKNREESKQIQYHVYDCFYCITDLFSDRIFYLEKTDRFLSAHRVETHRISTVATLDAFHELFLELGYEGSIIRANTPYKQGRSPGLLKRKDFQDSEFKITGFEEGTGKHVGCVIWVCENLVGYEFRVTPKATEDRRRELFKEATSHVGSLLKVKYFELTANAVPRFPVGLGIRIPEDI